MKEWIHLNPGDECGEETRAWQGCPTIVRTRKGRMFAGWYSGGMFEPCIDNYNILVYSDDDGTTWSRPILTVHSDREAHLRKIDIQLWLDEKGWLWVNWTNSPYPEDAKTATIREPFVFTYHKEFTGVETMICKNPDAEELVWEYHGVICEGFLRCKPIIDHRGRYLFPAYDWIHPDYYMIRCSEDGGQTFRNIPAALKPQNKAFDETMLYEVGTDLHMLARTNLGYYAHAFSKDGGETWSEVDEYQKAPSTRMYIGRLKSGRLVFVRNVSDTARTGMKICLSEDDGLTWKWELVLENREMVSYPDLCEDDAGNIYVIYDRERDNRIRMDRNTWTSDAAKEILLARVTEKDIQTGQLSATSYLKRIVSKGRMNSIEK